MNPPIATIEGQMQIGSITIDCAVLNDGRQVLHRRSFLLALGYSEEAASGEALTEVEEGLTSVTFQSADGTLCIGYEAYASADVCLSSLGITPDEPTPETQEQEQEKDIDIDDFFSALLAACTTKGISVLMAEALDSEHDPSVC